MSAKDAEPLLDCLIVGGGPAGLTAATYLARFHRAFVLVDAGKSRARWIPESHNCPGFPFGVAGTALLDKLRKQADFDGATLIGIDGIRAEWPDGWGLVRASNTTPVLVLRFESDTAQALARIEQVFRTQLLALDATLKLPF